MKANIGVYVVLSLIAMSAAYAAVSSSDVSTELKAPTGSTEDCVQAIKDGKVTGSIVGGVATVYNTDDQAYEVSLAVYKKFDENISNQIIYDWDNGLVDGNGQQVLTVDLPDCKYQIDLVCGSELQSLYGYPAVQYGPRKIKWYHLGGPDYCQPDHDVPEFGTLAAGVTIAGALVGLVAFRRRH